MTSSIDIPAMMKAVVLTGHGGLDRYEFHDDWPTPQPGQGEVLVKVHACGLNNTDVNTRTGWYAKGVTEATTGAAFEEAGSDTTWGGSALSFPRIQGADVCGTVVAIGEGGDDRLLGRRVLLEPWIHDRDDPSNLDRSRYLGSETDGGFAGYVAIDSLNAHPVDSELSAEQLATFPTSYVTAENMLTRASVVRGDSVLITGASGGVGSALIQLARRRGATTIALASASKHPALEDLGADVILPRNPDDLRGSLLAETGRDTVDVVADVVGGSIFPNLIDRLAQGGRYTVSGAIAGPIVELDLRTLYLRDLSFFGATIAPRDVFANLVDYIERGEIRPLVAASYPLARLAEAQQAFIDKQHVGNIVVSVETDA